MKYKVGQKVIVKSLDWYNENKDNNCEIKFENGIFTTLKSTFIGQIMTIEEITSEKQYILMEDKYKTLWTDEMIECRVEEETKFGTALNPLEIKSNANCLTQEKVDKTKPEPEPKFKVGDKITNGKKKLLILNIVSDKYIVEDNLGECGTVYFNTQDDWKLVEEEIDDCKKCGLVRNSTRCLSMDNCPYNKQRKFNVGDIVYSKTWQRNVIIHEILPGCFYKVGDLFSTNWFKEYENNLCKEIVKPTTEYTLPDGHIFKDENGKVINATKIVLEKKKKEYPQTYEECCKVMNYCCNPVATKTTHKEELIRRFQFLLLYRDAYWKIAGEEMGLGKPWEPSKDKMVYSIYRHSNKIETDMFSGESVTFEFPTKEMRDAFFENFNKDIEICKEFL